MINAIDIIALEWFDKVNGNSYFAATVTTNFGQPDQKDYKLPFQYGYGEHYIDMAKQLLMSEGVISIEKRSNGTSEALWSYCRENNIILRTTKHENCKKAELKNL